MDIYIAPLSTFICVTGVVLRCVGLEQMTRIRFAVHWLYLSLSVIPKTRANVHYRKLDLRMGVASLCIMKPWKSQSYYILFIN